MEKDILNTEPTEDIEPYMYIAIHEFELDYQKNKEIYDKYNIKPGKTIDGYFDDFFYNTDHIQFVKISDIDPYAETNNIEKNECHAVVIKMDKKVTNIEIIYSWDDAD